MHGLITDLAIMLLTAGVVAVVFRRFKQPLVLGYILAGFLVGQYMPYFFTVTDSHSIEIWSEIGIIVLMFSLGLEFNLHKLASVGSTAIITALTEVFGMLVVGYLVGQALGWDMMDSIFLGGIIGVITGVVMAQLISRMMQIPVSISAPAIIIAVVFSTLIGVVFGMLPAVQAANLNPIEALRRN